MAKNPFEDQETDLSPTVDFASEPPAKPLDVALNPVANPGVGVEQMNPTNPLEGQINWPKESLVSKYDELIKSGGLPINQADAEARAAKKEVIQTLPAAPTIDQFMVDEAQPQQQQQQQQQQQIPQIPVMGPAERTAIGSYQKQMNANAAIAAAQAKSFADTARVLETANGLLENQQLEYADKLRNYKDTVKGYADQIESLSNEIKDSKPEFKDYWADKSTGFKVLAALAIGAGIHAESHGGTNVAMKAIDNAIEKDLAQQKYAYEQQLAGKKSKLSSLDSLYNKAVNTFQDEVAAEAYTKEILLEQTKNKLNEIAAKSGQAQAPQKAAMLNAELTRQQQLAYQQFDAAIKQKAYLATLTPNKLKNMTDVEMLQAGIPKEQIEAKRRDEEVTIAGTDIRVPDKETRRRLEEEIGSTSVAVNGLKELLALTDPKKFSKLSPNDRKDARQKINELAGDLRIPILGPGPMIEKEYDRLVNDVIGNPTEIIKLETDANLRKRVLALANSIDNKMKIKIAPYRKGGKSPVNAPIYNTAPKK